MSHLADPDASNKTIPLKKGEEFIGFIEKYPIASNASISFLLKIEKEQEQ